MDYTNILLTVIALGSVALLLAAILYAIAQKFKVYEDPRIDIVEKILPGANCGGCGYAGCRALAEAAVKAEDLSTVFCPVGGNGCMQSVAQALGKVAEAKEPMVAVVRCGGSPLHRPRTNTFVGAQSCAVIASVYAGETGCTFGCIGRGDCTAACTFGAIHMNPETQLPEVVDDKCTACGACVKACPKFVIELRKKGPKNRRIFVSCINKDKGAIARKACKVACIGCGACKKACEFEAITIENSLAYINFAKCKLCRKCAVVCPTNAILELNFPLKKKVEETPVAASA